MSGNILEMILLLHRLNQRCTLFITMTAMLSILKRSIHFQRKVCHTIFMLVLVYPHKNDGTLLTIWGAPQILPTALLVVRNPTIRSWDWTIDGLRKRQTDRLMHSFHFLRLMDVKSIWNWTSLFFSPIPNQVFVYRQGYSMLITSLQHWQMLGMNRYYSVSSLSPAV